MLVDSKSNPGKNSAVEDTPWQSFVQLPSIALPKFDEKAEGWCKFRDSFVSLIDQSNSIPNIPGCFQNYQATFLC